MVKGLVLEIEYICECQSTQTKLIEDIKSFKKSPPCALIADYQSNGIGSRANSWQSPKGNLYLSFALNENDLPKDLEPASASIYFAFILVLTLRDMGSKLWLKWPNDIYLGNRKIAGIITTKSKGVYICGIGMNLKNSPHYADCLDIELNRDLIVDLYFKNLNLKPQWKQIFSKYLIEFELSKNFCVHIDDEQVSLSGAILQNDGSIIINNKRVYSAR